VAATIGPSAAALVETLMPSVVTEFAITSCPLLFIVPLTPEESVPALTAAEIARFKALTVLPPEPALKTNVPPVPESVMLTVELAANAVEVSTDPCVEVKLTGALLENTFWPLKLVDWPI
jgi:hypothetical protein